MSPFPWFLLVFIGCTSAQWTSTSIMLPRVIYVGQETTLVISTGRQSATITYKTHIAGINTSIDDVATQYITRKGTDGRYTAQIPYRISFYPPVFEEVELFFNFTLTLSDSVKQVVEMTLVKRLPALLLGETDKPIYRPGETVRARFITIDRRSRTGVLPRQKVVYTKGNNKLHLQALTREEEKAQAGLRVSNYSAIYVTDPGANRVKQWLNVSLLGATTLEYPLLANALEGKWGMTAERSESRETVAFTVERYVLPRFVVTVVPPSQLSVHSRSILYSLCVKYTTDLPMRKGTVRSNLCVCPSGAFKDQPESETIKMLQAEGCPKRFKDQRPCVESTALLSVTTGCANLSLPLAMLNLSSLDQTIWDYLVYFCALVEEDGTGSTVVQCHSGLKVLRSSEHISLTVAQFYHPNLPLLVEVVLTEPDLQPMSNISVRIEVREQGSVCDGQLQPGPRYRHVADVYTDKRGVVTHVVPPVQSVAEWLFVSAEVHGQRNYRSQHRRVRIWQNHDHSVSLQLWPLSRPDTLVTCPGDVRLRLMGNIPLSDKTFYVQSVSRGKHLMQTISPISPEPCSPRDDELGHYRCVPGGIHCLPAWNGSNCIEFHCQIKCNPLGGLCVSGKLCLCHEGWIGHTCETCLRRLNCLHGDCIHGNDCVCQSGWSGRLCDQSLPADNHTAIVEQSELKGTKGGHQTNDHPRQTIFERDISIRVDNAWGPRAWAVVFFYTGNGSEGSTMVGTSVELSGLVNCTSRAISLQSQSKVVGLSFDRETVNPGQSVKLTVQPSGIADARPRKIGQLYEDLSEQVCFFRISDSSLEKVDNIITRYIDVDLFAERMSQYEDSIDKSVAFEDDLTTAFKKAGIYLSVPANWDQKQGRRSKCKRTQHLQPSVDTSVGNGPPSLDPPRPRLREFFPEIWLFDSSLVESLVTNATENKTFFGVQRTLIVPDSLTTWKASVFCTTQSNGLWISQPALLKVKMPFYIEVTLPKEVKRDEILHLPLNLFATNRNNDITGYNGTSPRDCFLVHVWTDQNEEDWEAIGDTDFIGCLCSGTKLTYTLSLMAKRLGDVSVEAKATARGSLCTHSERVPATTPTLGDSHMYSDRVRHLLRVIPEGTRGETTVGDILCLSKATDRRSRRFPIHLPDNIVDDSLSVYITYSDEILGPALENLDKLIKLPKGCGEQNMISIAPNVYVLGYLKAVPGRDAGRTAHLVRRIKSNIVEGYRKQLKFRRRDGSFSAFGESDQEGSTWLTAFILRVLGRAYNVDPNIPIDWNDVFNTSIQFLITHQDSSIGCFIEHGRVLHTSMQSSFTPEDALEKNLSLTAHVISALHEIKRSHDNGTMLHHLLHHMITRALNCIDRLIGADEGRHLSTHTIAQLAYAYTLSEPKSRATVALNVNLMQRRLFLRVGKAERFEYWQTQWPDSFPNWHRVEQAHHAFHEVTSGDIEVTSLAYLTMVNVRLTLSQLAPMIRWLALCQKFHGGFLSTQDTVLALEAISDFATRLEVARAHDLQNDLEDSSAFEQGFDITIQLRPLDTHLNYQLTEETHRTVNQVALLPSLFSKAIDSVEWNVVAEPPGRTTGCLSIQTAFIYHVHNDGINSPSFKLRATIDQAKNRCNESLLEISLESRDAQETGMLLLIVEMVTGWEMIEKSVFEQVTEWSVNSLRKVEVNTRGKVFLYFNGFSKVETNPRLGARGKPKRYARIVLKQTIIVQSPKPAVITAMDYYATHRRVSTEYSLFPCLESSRTKESETRSLGISPEFVNLAQQPHTCPRCEIEEAYYFYPAVCTNKTSTTLIKKTVSGDLSSNTVTFSKISSNGQSTSWVDNWDDHFASGCSCKNLLKRHSQLVILSTGEKAVNLKIFNRNSVILPVTEASTALTEAVHWWRKESRTGLFNLTSSRLHIDQCNHVLLLKQFIESHFA